MTVVVGYIPTPEGRAALQAALREALLRRSKLVVVNARAHEAYADPHALEAADILEELSAWGPIDEVDVSVELPPVGSGVVHALLDVISSHDAELLIVGLRHRTAVGKLLLGSTAQSLILQAPCDVLGVKVRD